MALLHLSADFARREGIALRVVTVDHGLRAESASEAAFVAAACRDLDLPHETLTWESSARTGNLQAAAREARKSLLRGWAGRHGLSAILTGHTSDDQAETVLLRLARGSGIDGLAGIEARSHDGIDWIRPLLEFGRAELREWLTAQGIGWIDDPSNDDPRFDRARARAMMGSLADLGLSADRLIELSRHMHRARSYLAGQTQELARDIVTQDRGDLLIAVRDWQAAPDELRLRLLAAGIRWIAGAPYRPRFAPLGRMARDMHGTLGGSMLTATGGFLRLHREWKAVAAVAAASTRAWDRWRLDGPHSDDLRIAAIGANGLQCFGEWRATGLPPAALHAQPGIWRGDALIAAPLAGWGNGWTARLLPGRDDFHHSLLSH